MEPGAANATPSGVRDGAEISDAPVTEILAQDDSCHPRSMPIDDHLFPNDALRPSVLKRPAEGGLLCFF